MKQTDKKSFILYGDFAELFGLLSFEDRGRLITAIFNHESAGEAGVELPDAAKMAFVCIKNTLDRDRAAYEEKCEKNAENGRKGGRPRKAATSPAEAKKPVRVEIPDGTPKKPAERLVAVVDDGFEAWWKEYPKKVGKGDARRSWGKIKPGKALQETMLKTLRAARESDQWKADGGKYIPNPSTWLNQERWSDDVSTYTRRAVRQTAFHNVESRPDDDIEAWALRKQLAELGAQ